LATNAGIEPAGLSDFRQLGGSDSVAFVQTVTVASGVTCHVYKFLNDDSRDLAIVEVQAGCKTPLQRVIGGDETIEGYFSGKGTLAVRSASGHQRIYEFHEPSEKVFVRCGDLMQWQAAEDQPLVFFEVCKPPYQDGRFENLSPDP
jgi:hypothetical protein